MKRERFFKQEVRYAALHELERRFAGGLNFSDHDSNWNWGLIFADSQQKNPIGAYVRFALQVFSISFAEMDFYPVFNENYVIEYWVRKFDLTNDELYNLRINGFLVGLPEPQK